MAIELAELIGRLRSELTEAMRAGAGEDLRFELGPVELELSVVVDKEATSGGKVRFWVVEAGADARATASSTQRITLSLQPRQAGKPGQVPWVSGVEQSGER